MERDSPGRYAADSISFEAFSDAILAIVHDQESAGLDVISDGLMVSGDSPFAAKLYYLTERIAGFTPYGPSMMLPTYSTEHSPVVDGKLTRKCPLYCGAGAGAAQGHRQAHQGELPGRAGPAAGVDQQVLLRREGPGLRSGRGSTTRSSRNWRRRAVDVIQLDEFTWHFGLSLGGWEVDAFNAAIDGVDADIHVHVCWGNYLGTSGYLPTEPVQPGRAPDKDGTEYIISLRERDAGTARPNAIFPRAHAAT